MTPHRDPFLARFHPSEAGSAATAKALIDWADSKDFVFRPGTGRTLPTIYLLVPPSRTDPRSAEYLLTLQVRQFNARGHMKGIVDVPFRRMRGRAFGQPHGPGRVEFLRRLNAILPPDEQVSIDRLGNDRGSFATINYAGIETPQRRDALIGVLEWAAAAIRN